MNLFDKRPAVSVDSFVAPNASLIGDVELNDKSSVWYGAVLRADVNRIKVGAVTNIQDRAVVTVAKENPDGFPTSTTIGNYVSVGHGAVLSACTVEDEVIIGPGAIVLDGALVEKNAIVEAGTVVPPGRRVPSGQIWAGNPATFVRNVEDSDVAEIKEYAERMATVANTHSDEFLPYGTAYLDNGTYNGDAGNDSNQGGDGEVTK